MQLIYKTGGRSLASPDLVTKLRVALATQNDQVFVVLMASLFIRAVVHVEDGLRVVA